MLAIAFAVFWIPERYRGRACPPSRSSLAVLYPFYQPKMFTIPVFGAWPDVATGVVMLVFIMMAVGLNIVVGYAGLLDLGYVAFYAMGAYTAAWFSSLQFAERPTSVASHFGARPSDSIAPDLRRASTSRSGCCSCSREWSPRSSGSSSACRRCGCAVTTSRS